MSFKKFVSVLLDVGLNKCLEYGVPEEDFEKVEKGVCVQVPLRGVLRNGIVINVSETSTWGKVSPIKKVISPIPLITDELFELALWISRYYHTPLGKVMNIFFPKSVRTGMGHKKQQVVLRNQSLEEIRNYIINIRNKGPKAASLLDQMLKVKKDILLTELLEKSQASRSTVTSLVKKGILSLSETIVDRDPLKNADFFPSKPKQFNEEQQQAYDFVRKSLDENCFKVQLLYGVTGSGKTEVYLQAISHALSLGKTALMLVPEIALTTQTIERFKSRFDDKIAVLHHRLSQGERFDQWYDIREGKASIVIGARSAIFAPIKNLGLIIIDEEHESSYKQTEEMPTYHARDLAVMRGKLQSATVILGSATPSLESYYNTQIGKYHLSMLTKRPTNFDVPKMTLMDMKKEFEKAKGYTLFSDLLLKGIKTRFERGEQVLLFLNRRGYHTALICSNCAYTASCPQCEIALTYHLKEDSLACHLCNYRVRTYRTCPKCKDQTFKYKGTGTEKVERNLKAIFPTIRTLRVDADTTRHVGSYEKLYYAFKNQKADVLIGTQMIAKGLHFPAVTLVGVLNCDTQLNIPDFRASENVFQLVTQVAGRAGRGDIKGEVLIQTFNTENKLLNQAIAGDFQQFFHSEMESRSFFSYPPLTHLMKIIFRGKDEKKVIRFGERYYHSLKVKLNNQSVIHPLSPCGYSKIKEFYRYQLLLKGANVYSINEVLSKVQSEIRAPSDIKMLIDIDPISTFS